ncbi:hypothetical protein NQ314_005819 [Rhamnusium bicolor]|uniref:THAP-type domain-containing protein n=1 Tax=Rhamnusium bicolor TaxID=1586634 RepID=A0AAV8ZCI3_9CUCU|nr:hypothetical protein NQ314_005819 [Rhamnusium bicolor]
MDSDDRKKTVQEILVSVPDYMQKVQCDTNIRTSPFKCAVSSCQNVFLCFEERAKYPYKFHNFPHNYELCNIWKEKCGLPENADISKLKVCSDHFLLDDYIRNYKEEFLNPNFKRKLQLKAIPQRNLSVNNVNGGNAHNDDILCFSEVKEAVDENEMLRQKYDSLIDLLLGKKKKVFWTDDDLAKAFTLRHIGSSNMLSCAVFGCTNESTTSDSSIQYYTFPKNIISQQWIQACGWQSAPIDLNTAHICSVHFDENAYDTELKIVNFTACYTKTLRYDAVPTLLLPQTQIIIKEKPLELEDIKSVVVYINSTNENDGITTICLSDEALTNQFFQAQPSTSEIKAETHTNLKSEISEETEKYSHIKTYPELYVFQANNKSLKKKTETLEKEVSDLEQILNTKQNDLTNLETRYKNIVTKIKDKNFTLHEQKILLSKVFSESQIKILFGKQKLYWTNDDFAVGYTIRHLSNKRCYTYLTKKLNFPLPGLSSIKRWVTKNITRKLKRVKKEDE